MREPVRSKFHRTPKIVPAVRIGSHSIDNNLVVAPMAGVTDRPFRQLCKRLGAGLAFSEMVASNPLLRGTEKSQRRTDHAGEVEPIIAQIAGADLQAVQALDQRRARRLQLQASLPVPVQPAQDNGGYILAPSFAQASVAAGSMDATFSAGLSNEEGSIRLLTNGAFNAICLPPLQAGEVIAVKSPASICCVGTKLVTPVGSDRVLVP